jgi:hypothetical protein
LIVRIRRLRRMMYSPVIHPSDYQEEPAEPLDLPIDVVVARKRPTWLRDTLQDAKSYEEEQVAPPVVRQVAPQSTISEGARVQRESTLRSSREEQPPRTVHTRSRLQKRSTDAEGADGS